MVDIWNLRLYAGTRIEFYFTEYFDLYSKQVNTNLFDALIKYILIFL